MFIHCPSSMVYVLHNFHFPPLYQNPPLEVHLHSTPNILASIVHLMYLYGLSLFTLISTRLFSNF